MRMASVSSLWMGESEAPGPGLSDAAFRVIVETLSLPVLVTDAVGTVTYAGGSVERDFGYRPAELVGRNVLEFTPPDEAERALQSIDELGRADELGIGVPTAFPIICKDGSHRWMSIGAVPLLDTVVQGTTFYFMSWDAQRHLDAFFAALLADEPLNVVLGLLARSITVALQAIGVCIHFGFDGERFTGVTGTGHPARSPDPDSGPWCDAARSGEMQVVSLTGCHEAWCGAIPDSVRGFWSIPIPAMADVEPAVMTVWLPADSAPVRAHDFELSRSLGYIRLALMRSAEHRRLAYMADHDHLTGLLNRSRQQQVIGEALAADEELALLYLDLDGFKAVNDTRGHGVGDAVLVEVARRLREATAGVAEVARIGGDEFTVFVRANVATARDMADRLVKALDSPVLVQGEPVCLGVSVGLATGPARSVDDLLHRADVALYRAKRRGGGRVIEDVPPV